MMAILIRELLRLYATKELRQKCRQDKLMPMHLIFLSRENATKFIECGLSCSATPAATSQNTTIVSAARTSRRFFLLNEYRDFIGQFRRCNRSRYINIRGYR